MKIYEVKPQYDINTGKPIGNQSVRVASRCDVTGVVLDWDETDPEDLPYPSYILNYGNEDPMWGSGGEEYEFGQKYEIEMHEFLGDPYEMGCDSCTRLMREAAKQGIDFASAVRESRVRVATRLLEKGEIKPENLSGHDEGGW